MTDYNDYWYPSRDGLQLYARDYPATDPAATLICLPGLTRNSADFVPLCEQLARRYRILAPDFRGRGRSAYDPNPDNYHPGTYSNDVLSLLESLQLQSVILIGTSLGGLVSMILAAMHPQAIKAAIINDIGPEANPVGIARILAYVSNPAAVADWTEASRRTQQYLARDYPDFSDDDWAAFSKNIYRQNAQGQPVLDFDPNIAQLLNKSADNAVPPDLWPLFNSLQQLPMLVLRGELSEILTPQCLTKMQQQHPGLATAIIPNRGHAPLLTEPESLSAIEKFLAGVNQA